MAVLGSVIFDISANTAKIEKSLNKVNKRFGRMEKNTKRLASTMKTALVGAFAAIGAQRLFIGALKETIEFEKEMTNVATLLDTTRVSMGRFERDILALTTKVNRSASDLAKGLFEVVSAGVAAEDAMNVLEAAATSATAGVTTTKIAVLALTKSMAIYGVDSAGAMRVSDLLFKTVEKGQTTFEQLAKQIGRVLPFARALGLSMEEPLAVFAGMTTILGNTEQAATALEATFRAFIQNADRFKAAGIDINKALSEKGLIGTLKLLDKKTGGSAAALQKMGLETESLRGVLGLFGGKLNKVQEDLEDFKNATGAITIAFEKQMESTEEKIKAFGIAWSQLKISLSDKALPAITKGIDKLAGKLRFLNTQLGNREMNILERNIDKIRDRLERLNQEREGIVGKIVGVFLPSFFIDEIKEATEELEKLESKRAKILQERFTHPAITGKTSTAAINALEIQKKLEADREALTKKATEALKKQIAVEEELAKQFASAREIIVKSLNDEIAGRKLQIEGLEEFREKLFDTYDQASKKVNKFQEIQKSASEVKVSAIRGLEDILGPEKSPFERMKEDRIAIIEMLKESFKSEDVAVIEKALEKTREFLQKFKGIKDTFGFKESFFEVISLYKDLTKELDGIAAKAEIAGEAWGEFADEQVTQIMLVNDAIGALQDDIDKLQTALMQVPTVDINSDPAKKKLKELQGWADKLFRTLKKIANILASIRGRRAVPVAPTSSGFQIQQGFHAQPNLPQFQSGTSFVPETGPAIVHKGETIIPAEQEPGNVVNNFNITGDNPEEIARAIDRIMTTRAKNNRSQFARQVS